MVQKKRLFTHSWIAIYLIFATTCGYLFIANIQRANKADEAFQAFPPATSLQTAEGVFLPRPRVTCHAYFEHCQKPYPFKASDGRVLLLNCESLPAINECLTAYAGQVAGRPARIRYHTYIWGDKTGETVLFEAEINGKRLFNYETRKHYIAYKTMVVNPPRRTHPLNIHNGLSNKRIERQRCYFGYCADMDRFLPFELAGVFSALILIHLAVFFYGPAPRTTRKAPHLA
ncbi:hypothetical protein PQU92_17580 [Asticcacaulis sp. BYS171W]|uniref:Uncharacterized protein n=1 Tax=Asticcacaulis aquaticus TaxID=2984212 RepID=A0ABT5HYH0_9CAUL|nr:hypothetical protein [Asticcacaulis aquaticus]MDC7685099.1 hypothetical protein [Asticcacaulis aquaticus]